MLRTASIIAALIGTLSPLGARAQSSLDEIVRLDLLQGGLTERGTYQAAIRLTMAEGWKTYWRRPGDAGIPPHLSWKGSNNLASATPVWPTPVVFDQSGMRSIGYVSRLVLPLEIAPKNPGRKVRLSGSIEFGICHEVCIPAELDFSELLDPEAPRHPAIAAALAERPFSETEAGVGAVTCTLAPTQDGMRITAQIALPPTGGTEFAVFEPDDPEIWSSEAVVSRKGGTLTATSELVHVNGAPYVLDRSALRITVIGTRHAVDIRGCSAD